MSHQTEAGQDPERINRSLQNNNEFPPDQNAVEFKRDNAQENLKSQTNSPLTKPLSTEDNSTFKTKNLIDLSGSKTENEQKEVIAGIKLEETSIPEKMVRNKNIDPNELLSPSLIELGLGHEEYSYSEVSSATDLNQNSEGIYLDASDFDSISPHEVTNEGTNEAEKNLTRIQTIGDYTLVERLGRGGMGVVYRATQKKLQRDVALKLIAIQPNTSSEELERFRREARMIAALKHPNIVQIYDFGEQERIAYIAMEYISGGNLFDYMSQHQLPYMEAAILIENIARAIHYAHQNQIIHRDLKPANILLVHRYGDKNHQNANSNKPSEDQHPSTQVTSIIPFDPAREAATHDLENRQNLIPKITDFGLGKRTDYSPPLTETGIALGTPSYMSPEQARGDRDKIGPLSDVYALGAILYEIISGKPPFAGPNAMNTFEQICYEKPVAPRKIKPTIPVALEKICLRCLQKKTQSRYADAASLADELRDWISSQKLVELKPRSSYLLRITNSIQEKRFPVMVASFLMVWTVVLLIVTGIQLLDRFNFSPPLASKTIPIKSNRSDANISSGQLQLISGLCTQAEKFCDQGQIKAALSNYLSALFLAEKEKSSTTSIELEAYIQAIRQNIAFWKQFQTKSTIWADAKGWQSFWLNRNHSELIGLSFSGELRFYEIDSEKESPFQTRVLLKSIIEASKGKKYLFYFNHEAFVLQNLNSKETVMKQDEIHLPENEAILSARLSNNEETVYILGRKNLHQYSIREKKCLEGKKITLSGSPEVWCWSKSSNQLFLQTSKGELLGYDLNKSQQVYQMSFKNSIACMIQKNDHELELITSPEADEGRWNWWGLNLSENKMQMYWSWVGDYRSFWSQNSLEDNRLWMLEKNGELQRIADHIIQKFAPGYPTRPIVFGLGKNRFARQINEKWIEIFRLTPWPFQRKEIIDSKDFAIPGQIKIVSEDSKMETICLLGDHFVQLIHPKKMQQLGQSWPSKDLILAGSISPEGKGVVIATANNELIDLRLDQSILKVQDRFSLSQPVRQVLFARDGGRFFALASQNFQKPNSIAPLPSSFLNSLYPSTIIASEVASYPYPFQQMKMESRCQLRNNPILSISLEKQDKQGKQLWVGYEDGILRNWNLQANLSQKEMDQLDSGITAITRNFPGLIIVGNQDGSIHCWDETNKTIQHSWPASYRAIRQIVPIKKSQVVFWADDENRFGWMNPHCGIRVGPVLQCTSQARILPSISASESTIYYSLSDRLFSLETQFPTADVPLDQLKSLAPLASWIDQTNP